MPEDSSPQNFTGLNTADKSTLTISSGDVTVTRKFHVIAAESSTSDQLDGIAPSTEAPGDADGAELYIRPDASDTITVAHNQNSGATNNILIPGDASVVLTDDDIMFLIYDIDIDSNGAWIAIGWGQNAALLVHGIASHTEHANWKHLYTDGSGDEQELSLATVGKVLLSNGVAAAPIFGGAVIVQDSEPSDVHTGQAWLDTSTDATGTESLALTTKTAGYTITDSDAVILCDATSGAFTITLPTAAGRAGKVFYVKKIDITANAITIDGDGAETIDGGTTQVIATQYNSIMIISDGSNWHIL